MADHNDLGKLGEELAVQYLVEKDFTILHRNWRYSHYEIDIIAIKNDLPHFVEVKIRTSEFFGMPEESVTKKKLKSLFQAVNEFLYRHPQYKNFRIDVLSITAPKNGEPKFFLIEDVYQ